MDEEKYQKELFDEFEKPKRFFPKLSDFFPKGDFERNVVLTLTLDRAVFIAIGIIMVMVVLYALGIEAGKARTVEVSRQTAVPAVAPAVMPQVAKVVLPQAVKVAAPQIVKVVPLHPVKSVVPPVVKAVAPAATNVSKPYTIVVATFAGKETAAQEMVKLKKQGFTASLIQSGRYFQVCVGAYADKAGAEGQKDLKKVKRLYKDAYLRLK